MLVGSEGISPKTEERYSPETGVALVKKLALETEIEQMDGAVLQGKNLIDDYWQRPLPRSDERLPLQNTPLGQVLDRESLQDFFSKIREYAKTNNLSVSNKDGAQACYDQVVKTDPRFDHEAREKEIEAIDPSKLPPEAVSLMVTTARFVEEIREYTERLRNSCMQELDRHIAETGLRVPFGFDIRPMVNMLIDSSQFESINDFGRTPVLRALSTLLRYPSKENLRFIKRFAQEKPTEARRHFSTRSQAPDLKVEGFGEEDGKKIKSLVETLVPEVLRFRLEKIERTTLDPLAQRVAVSKGYLQSDIQFFGVYGEGTLRWLSEKPIETKTSLETALLLTHEVLHSDYSSLAYYPDLLAEYLAIVPAGDDALTEYVRELSGDNRELVLGRKYCERFSELIAHALLDPDTLDRLSPDLYKWAKDYLKRRLGENYNMEEEARKRRARLF